MLCYNTSVGAGYMVALMPGLYGSSDAWVKW